MLGPHIFGFSFVAFAISFASALQSLRRDSSLIAEM
jgi:hypothetical protein